jgi:hypothetical protein
MKDMQKNGGHEKKAHYHMESGEKWARGKNI